MGGAASELRMRLTQRARAAQLGKGEGMEAEREEVSHSSDLLHPPEGAGE